MGSPRGLNDARIPLTLVLLSIALMTFGVPNSPHGNDASTSGREDARSGTTLQLGAYFGGADTLGQDLEVGSSPDESLRITDLQWTGESFEAPIYYGFRATKWYSKISAVGLMMDFTHIKAIAPPDQVVQFEERSGSQVITTKEALRNRFERLQFSHGHNLLTMNGVFALPLFRGWIKPYVGLGAGVAVPHVEVRRRNIPREQWTHEYRIAGPALQALLGLQVAITKRVSIFFEHKVNYADIGVTLNDGERLRTQLLTHQGLSGITNTVSGPALP